MYFPKLQTPRKRHAFGVFLFVIAKLQLFFRLFRKGDHLAVGLLAQVVLDLAGVLGGRLRVNAQREGIAIAKSTRQVQRPQRGQSGRFRRTVSALFEPRVEQGTACKNAWNFAPYA